MLLPGVGFIAAALVVLLGGEACLVACWPLPTGKPKTTEEGAVTCTTYLITPVTFDKNVDPDEVARQFTEFVHRAFREVRGKPGRSSGVTFIGTLLSSPESTTSCSASSSGRPWPRPSTRRARSG